MFNIFEPPGEKAYLVYMEAGSKNNSGGLKHRKVHNKCVKIFESIENQNKCVVRRQNN